MVRESGCSRRIPRDKLAYASLIVFVQHRGFYVSTKLSGTGASKRVIRPPEKSGISDQSTAELFILLMTEYAINNYRTQ